MTLPKDLLHIAAHVRKWPKGNLYVRLDADGEICFSDCGGDDFYPDGNKFGPQSPHPAFVASGEGESILGAQRYYDEWLYAVNRVTAIIKNEDEAQTVDDTTALNRLAEKLRHERYSARFLTDILDIVRSTGRETED